MIQDRFSASVFRRLGRDSDEAVALAEDLAQAIADECLEEVRAAGEKVAARLRELGHQIHELDFEPYGAAFGLTYVDDSDGQAPSEHRLRFNLDLVVSTGYPGYRSTTEQDEDDGK